MEIANPADRRQFTTTFVVVAACALGVLFAMSASPVVMPRIIRRHPAWLQLGVFKSYADFRRKHAGRPRSVTALLTHAGRRSGKTYQTPLGAQPYGDGFVVSLPYGKHTDWCRNVIAAGTCRLAWRGQTYQLERPEIIPGAQVFPTLRVGQRLLLKGGGIQDFLWLHEKEGQPQKQSGYTQLGRDSGETEITQGKHMLLTTFRKNGAGVATPVWTVPVSDGRVGMWTGAGTGKYKRLRNNPHVTIQTCTARGQTKPGAEILDGTAEIVRSGARYDEVQTSIRAKYRWLIPIAKRVSRLQGRYKRGQSFGDTVVLISIAKASS